MSSKRPHLANAGQGVNRPQLREPGVSRQLPHLGDDGRGVNRLREPGVKRNLPHLTGNGQGVNRPQLREPGLGVEDIIDADYAAADGFHPMTMPNLRRWFHHLAARLRHVRIVNGDWSRVVTPGAARTLSVRQGLGPAGIFLDPPYGEAAERDGGIYAAEDLAVADAVRAWCLANGENPAYRIVLAGFDTEHADLEAHGWRAVAWYAEGFLTGGMGNITRGPGSGHQQHRERLWLSPHCLADDDGGVQPSLF